MVLTFCLCRKGGRGHRGSIRKMGATVCPIRIHPASRTRDQQPPEALELEPEGKAADELQRLYSYVCMNHGV